MLILNYLNTLGQYLILMGRSFSRPERMRMFFKRYVKEMSQLGVDSVGIVLLHRSSYLHTDETEHPKSVDAPLGVGLYHARDYVARIFIKHHVPYLGRKGGFEHRLRTWNDARYPADRRTRHHGR